MVNDMENQERRSAEFRSTTLFTGAAVFAGVLGLGGGPPKIVPGGPFISIFGELIPIAVSLGAIFVGLKGFNRMRGSERFWTLAFFALATIIIAGALLSILDFWLNPYARGDLIGF